MNQREYIAMKIGSLPSDRRSLLKAVGVGAVGIAGMPMLAACTTQSAPAGAGSSDPGASGTPSASLLPAPEPQVKPLLDQQKVNDALAKLDGMVQSAMESTGVPGVAVAVVYRDQMLYAKGFGVRESGKPETVDADTVFQLASVSKPLASTVAAVAVGRKAISWTEPVINHSPGFALKDPYVTRNATAADLLSHQGGLKTGAGDLLEDLGFDQSYILSHLNQQPLDFFRSSYNYSNFGYTAGALAVADAMKLPWADLAEEVLFKPLGMTSTSYRHADYQKASNRALIHVPAGNKTWVAKYSRDADAEAPAGGASSSVHDLARWIRLQLANGSFEGKEVIDPDALGVTHVPHAVSGPPPTPAARTRFYGLGWNVSYDDHARLSLGHSGAFNLGAATAVSLLPGEQLGIVALTNGRPQGIPEAICAAFLDTAQNGAPTVDWLGFTAGVFQKIDEAEKPKVDYSKTPPRVEPARGNDFYVGSYANSYYGPLSVAVESGVLSLELGPAGRTTKFALKHFDGNTFSFESIGENANGLAGAIFAPGADGAGGTASSVRLDFYDQTGLGTFTRG
ncbi:CubicO group peptidase, beta-lactamase class C family [Arthrobacter sp. ov407]|uniref:serine hydrolase n=1 Tax=Arthrobacter sp. ov407 TaxID=1761748 RepID=UPI0008839F1E|nr:serine hydrolase [Arthrobacter sp. ov407]SDL92520.1 CubicO group peptidase, beta-lactamase class C family [Arthrobacter sp. ov407]